MRDGSDGLVDHTKKFEGSYGFIAKSMARDIKDIYKWYDKGATAESRYLLHQVSENCVSCHMKLPDQGQAPRMDQFFKNVAITKLSAPEKARLQVALRQFDEALATWEDMFKSWPKPSELFAIDALPEYLKVAIRVKGDAKRASAALDQLTKRGDLPKFMEREASAWKTSLQRLRPEIQRKGQELERANRIIQTAKRTMEYPMDRTGLVDYIVASSLLNQYLSQNKLVKADKTAEAYYLLGITESLIGRSTWLTQTDYYYEAAVRTAPKSKIASKAFDALEQQLLMEYSGSGGTHIPEDVQANLDELRGLLTR
jgi:tetratricopeptide (TPR) repeat protein